METTDEPYRPTIHTQADLERVWRYLMRPLAPHGYDGASVWMLRIEPDHRPIPHLIEIAGADDVPDAAQSEGFVQILQMLESDDPGGSFAFLRSRPGGHPADADDLAWASYLYEVVRGAGLAIEVVHLATDADIVPLPLDALRQRSA